MLANLALSVVVDLVSQPVPLRYVAGFVSIRAMIMITVDIAASNVMTMRSVSKATVSSHHVRVTVMELVVVIRVSTLIEIPRIVEVVVTNVITIRSAAMVVVCHPPVRSTAKGLVAIMYVQTRTVIVITVEVVIIDVMTMKYAVMGAV